MGPGTGMELQAEIRNYKERSLLPAWRMQVGEGPETKLDCRGKNQIQRGILRLARGDFRCWSACLV